MNFGSQQSWQIKSRASQLQIFILIQSSLIMHIQNLSKELQKREDAFFQYLYQISTNSVTNNNQIYYKKFLKEQFNTFAIGEGYPLISLQCNSSLCYFYVRIQNVKDFQDDFLKFINRQMDHYSCKNCKKNINKSMVIYDTALRGLIQFKISYKNLELLERALITKEHQILFKKESYFNEAFNNQRLNTISVIKQSVVPQNNIEDKSLQVNSYEVVNSIHNNILNSQQFTGQLRPSEQMIITKQNHFQSILAISIHKKNGKSYLHVFKQYKDRQNLIKIELQFNHKPAVRIAQYYDSTRRIFYYLTSNGTLYKCDLRYMYNFASSKYRLQKWCNLLHFPTGLRHYANNIIVRQDDLYLFVSTQQNRFIDLYKAKVPFEKNSDPIQLKQILKDQIFNRFGYSVSFIRKRILLVQECIIIYGGFIQKIPNFKLFEIVALGEVQKYINIRLQIGQEYFPIVGHINFPTISICMEYLVVVGGYDQSKQMDNTSVIMISMKQKQTVIKVEYGQPKKCKIQQAHFSNSSIIASNSTTIVIGNIYNNTLVITINKDSKKSEKPQVNCIKYD